MPQSSAIFRLCADGRDVAGRRRWDAVGMMSSSPMHDGAARVVDASSEAPLLKLEDFLPHRLNVLSSLVSLALTRVYGRRYGIGIPEWRVLVTLGEFGV